MTVYYCRADGTASTVAAAIGPATTISACMPVSVLNAGSFSPGDEVVFSGRGGDFTSLIVFPSSGASDVSRINLSAESGYIPNFASGFKQNNQSYLTLNDLTAGTQAAPVVGTGFQFSGSALGLICNSISAYASSQGVAVGESSTDTVSVIFNDLIAELVNGGTEGEAWTSHGAITAVINGGTLTASGGDGCIESAGAPTVTFNDATCVATNGADAWKQSATGIWTMNRCVFEEDPDKTDYGPDFTSSTYCYLYDCIFKNLTDGAYYLIFYTGALEHHVINCTFIGDGVNTTIPIFNQSPNGKYINNVFKNCGGTKCFYGTNGTISNNSFYGSGTPSGTNYITADPFINDDGKIISVNSPLISAGIGPTSDSDIPLWDINNQERSGVTTDIGARLWILFTTTQNFTWKITSCLEQLISWVILCETDREISFKTFNKTENDVTWKIFSINDIETSWKILINSELNQDVSWKIKTLTDKIVGWKIINEKILHVSWEILKILDINLAYKIFSWLEHDTSWAIVDTETVIPNAVYMFNSATRNLIFYQKEK